MSNQVVDFRKYKKDIKDQLENGYSLFMWNIIQRRRYMEDYLDEVPLYPISKPIFHKKPTEIKFKSDSKIKFAETIGVDRTTNSFLFPGTLSTTD